VQHLIHTLAVFSPCKKYRYRLWRSWDEKGPVLTIIGLNPSRADASYTDPTIRRCQDFARRWGYGSLHVVNLFAYRSPYPAALRAFRHPNGPENDWHIKQAVADADLTLVAWGNDGIWKGRDRRVIRWIPDPYCLKQNKSGQPAHPLYQPKSKTPQPFDAQLLPRR